MTTDEVKCNILPGLKEALRKELGIPDGHDCDIKPSHHPGRYDVTLTVRGELTSELADHVMRLHQMVRYGQGKLGNFMTIFL